MDYIKFINYNLYTHTIYVLHKSMYYIAFINNASLWSSADTNLWSFANTIYELYNLYIHTVYVLHKSMY